MSLALRQHSWNFETTSNAQIATAIVAINNEIRANLIVTNWNSKWIYLMTVCVPWLIYVNLVNGDRDIFLKIIFCAVVISHSLILFTVGPIKLACKDGITERREQRRWCKAERSIDSITGGGKLFLV